MQVSFVIPLYNCLAHTRDCLRTLQSTLPPGLAHEILLVDDGSTDGTREWLATLPPPCRAILNEQNLGFAGACNRGADAATGELLFFLNNDLVLTPGWFEPVRDAFARFPGAGLVGNVQRSAATGVLDHTGIRFAHHGKPEHDTARPPLSRLTGFRCVPAVTGACLALRRALWHESGGFDVAFRNGGEDVDLAFRLSRTGHRHYVALRSVVLHHVSASPGRKRRDEENSRLLATRWADAIRPHAARAWCRHFITAHWESSHIFDHATGRDALLHLLGLLPPTPAILAGVAAAMEIESQRWRELLDGAAPVPPPQADYPPRL